jgi:hypothetical protein
MDCRGQEVYDLIYLMAWTEFFAVIQFAGSRSSGIGREVLAKAARAADLCLATAILAIRGLFAPPAPEDSAAASLPELEFCSGEVWDSQAELEGLVMLERLHTARLFLAEWTRQCLPQCIMNPLEPLVGRELFDRLREVTVAGLRDFPLHPLLLHSFVSAHSRNGFGKARWYFSSLVSRRLWGGGLALIEKMHLLHLLLSRAHGGNSSPQWSGESFSAIVGNLEDLLVGSSRDHLFGGDAGLWLLYFRVLASQVREKEVRVQPRAARGVFYRALSMAGACKLVWMGAMSTLRGAFEGKELAAIIESLEDCGFALRGGGWK